MHQLLLERPKETKRNRAKNGVPGVERRPPGGSNLGAHRSFLTVVGIELWRATTLVHVSIGPPAIPDGRISRVRF